ncbi:MAG: hypothetical protein KDE59_16310 [Anaerolineales bacterium]|nr:hypothetical protein [Anaerolineales bacterium]
MKLLQYWFDVPVEVTETFYIEMLEWRRRGYFELIDMLSRLELLRSTDLIVIYTPESYAELVQDEKGLLDIDDPELKLHFVTLYRGVMALWHLHGELLPIISAYFGILYTENDETHEMIERQMVHFAYLPVPWANEPAAVSIQERARTVMAEMHRLRPLIEQRLAIVRAEVKARSGDDSDEKQL